MLVLVSLYGGFAAANLNRFPQYGYAWLVRAGGNLCFLSGTPSLWLYSTSRA